MPTITLSLITIGALVPVSPFFGSPFLTLHTTLPVFASSATNVLSAWARNVLPSPKATPRLTVSQHITGMTVGSCFGSYFHRICAFLLRSSANTLFGNGVWTYMTSPTTRGPPSWPRNTPVEKVQSGRRFLALSLLIWLSSLYRVFA